MNFLKKAGVFQYYGIVFGRIKKRRFKPSFLFKLSCMPHGMDYLFDESFTSTSCAPPSTMEVELTRVSFAFC